MHKVDAVLTKRKWIVAICLAGLVVLNFSIKYHFFTASPYYTPQTDKHLFWTEGAYHYYFAREVAAGNGIATPDTRAQYPEGIDVYEHLTPLMDILHGNVYRAFIPKRVPFHVFLVFAVCALSAFTVLPVYFASTALWRSPQLAMMSAALYSVSIDAIMRTGGGGYQREDFALVFLFSSVALYLHSAIRFRMMIANCAGVCLVIALAGWHMSPFFVLIFLTLMSTELLVSRELPGSFRTLCTITLYMIVAGLLLPHLRAKLFITSFTVVVPVATIIVSIAIRKRNLSRLSAVGGALVVCLVIATTCHFLTPEHLREFSHVYELILAKLRHFGATPTDPALLTYEARSMWNSSFISPPWSMIKMGSLALTALGLLGWLRCGYVCLRGDEAWWKFLFGLGGVVFFVLYLLIIRLSIFPIFFNVVMIGMLFVRPFFRNSIVPWLLVVLAFAYESWKLTTFTLSHHRPAFHAVQDVTDRIRRLGTESDAVLAPFPMSSTILAYANKPILIHSKFESERLREKIKDTESAIFESEERFYEVCRKYDAAYFVYDATVLLDTSPGSKQYVHAIRAVTPDQAVYRLHLRPELLSRFQLLYQNERYRIFQVGKPYDAVSVGGFRQLTYDRSFLEFDEGNLTTDILKRGFDKIARRNSLMQIGHTAKLQGSLELARGHYAIVAGSFPSLPDGHLNLGAIALREGDSLVGAQLLDKAFALDPLLAPVEQGIIVYDAIDRKHDVPCEVRRARLKALNILASQLDLSDKQLINVYERALSLAPGNPEFTRTLLDVYRHHNLSARAKTIIHASLQNYPSSQLYFAVGNHYFHDREYAKARDAYVETILLDRTHIEAHNNLGLAHKELGEIPRAIECFQNALKVNSKSVSSIFNLGLAYYAQGNTTSAVEQLRKVLEVEPDDISALLNLATLTIETGDPNAAKSYLDLVLRSDPENRAAKSLLESLSDR